MNDTKLTHPILVIVYYQWQPCHLSVLCKILKYTTNI